MKKLLLLFGLFVMGLPVVGLLYQRLAERIDALRFPPPGKLVDVGGYRLHLYCMGKAGQSPTVILEAGLGSTYLDWSRVQPEVAAFAHVCSYDRAGLGWSEGGTSPRSCSQMVTDLHTLLVNAHIPGPYILVAHSFGGLIVRLYADMYPQEVAGLVLVDTSHEDQLSVPALAQGMKKDLRFLALARILASFGLVRLAINAGLRPNDVTKYPPAIRRLLKASWKRAQAIQTVYREMVAFEAGAAQVRASRRFYNHLPLVVLTQSIPSEALTTAEKRPEDAWQAFQQDLVSLSSQSTQVIAEQSGHYIQLEQPELVVEAIKTVLQLTRDN